METLFQIIDRSLGNWVNTTLNSQVHENRDDDSYREETEGSNILYPVASGVTIAQLSELEHKLGCQLPMEFKQFLSYKHFHELHISEASFCSHPMHGWKKQLFEFITTSGQSELLFESGYLPFAEWSDWGYLCFNANVRRETAIYPIVLWDNDRPEEMQLYANSFYELILKLQQEEQELNADFYNR